MSERFSREPFERLSRMVTRAPAATRARARWEPINPAPPVTSTGTSRNDEFMDGSCESFLGGRRHGRVNRDVVGNFLCQTRLRRNYALQMLIRCHAHLDALLLFIGRIHGIGVRFHFGILDG